MEKKVSKAVLKRLPGYLAYLKSTQGQDSPYISATALAVALGMGEVQVRKDNCIYTGNIQLVHICIDQFYIGITRI